MQTSIQKLTAKAKLLFPLLFMASSFSGLAQTNTWTQKSDFGHTAANVPEPTPRSRAAGFSIGSKGYIGTGLAMDGFKNDFWEYDPVDNIWTQKADFGGTARRDATAFNIGSKGYLGTGYDIDGTYKNDFWEYDPITNTWIQKADFGGIGREDAVGFSINNKGYIGTGYNNGGKKDFWEYDPAFNLWSQKSDFGGGSRYTATGFSINSKGYIGTGYDGNSKKDFWEYDPATNSWTQKVHFGGSARSGAVSFSIGSKGYIGTGYHLGTYYEDFWEYDPITNVWIKKADFDGIGRESAVGFGINIKGYIGTGYPNSGMKDFWEYDPTTNNWTQKADFGGSARSGAVGFSIGSKGYMGTGYSSTYLKDFWEYDPNINSWTQKADFGGSARSGAVGFSIGNKGYIGTGYSSPAYLKDFWEYNPIANVWKQKADYGGAARSGAIGFSIGNKGYMGTGGQGKYNDLLYSDFWEYDQSSNIWIEKANFGGNARFAGVGFSIAGKGYVGTGVFLEVRYNWWNSLYFYHYNNNFWEYDPVMDIWTQKAKFKGSIRAGAVGFSIGNKGYIGTGYEQYENVPLFTKMDFWEYDADANKWNQKADFGGGGRSGAVGFSIGNKGYIGTGSDVIASKKDFWEYSPSALVSVCDMPVELSTVNIASTSATLKWSTVSGAMSYQVLYKSSGTSLWSLVNSSGNEKTLIGLSPDTEYEWKVKSICSLSPFIQSENSLPFQFITNPFRQSDYETYEPMFSAYPNPLSQSTTVSFSLNEISPVVIEIMDVNGRSIRVIANNNFSSGTHEVTFNRESLIAGIYFLQLKTNVGMMMKKVVIE
ncbi:MAG: T9SS type A sorting domain-containing protein [Chitinophagaceae bacterium]|nr:T9SS type A sorting domain-containing protein [Chitinophagaceae bacterium]